MEEREIRHGLRLRYHFEATDGRRTDDGHIFLTVLDGQQRSWHTRARAEPGSKGRPPNCLNRHKCQKFRDISHARRITPRMDGDRERWGRLNSRAKLALSLWLSLIRLGEKIPL